MYGTSEVVVDAGWVVCYIGGPVAHVYWSTLLDGSVRGVEGPGDGKLKQATMHGVIARDRARILELGGFADMLREPGHAGSAKKFH